MQSRDRATAGTAVADRTQRTDRMMVPVAEVTMFERHMTEPEHEVAIAELEHQTALAEVPESSRLELWDVSELGRKTTVAEVPEVTGLERTMLSKDATVVDLEAMLSQVQLRAGMSGEMARTEASVTCLGSLRRYCQCHHDSCEHHHFAHRVGPGSGERRSPERASSGAAQVGAARTLIRFI